ncbi:MAG: FtsQ-type POTRA domain-containing protein [Patescibacteria group bacterium]|nr:FtsQ-type POTRA domain-containing protein [Patescibacteria group bacterium]
MKKKKNFRKSYRAKKKKKSLSKNKFLIYGILVLITIICLFYLFLLSWFFQIEKIEISGNEKIKAREIENLINNEINKKILFIPCQNIFLANLNNIEKNLSNKFPRINAISAQKKFPRTLKIKIQEKQAIGVFIPNMDIPRENNENSDIMDIQNEIGFLIDKQGVIFEKINLDEHNKKLKIKNLILDQECQLNDIKMDKNIIAKILKIAGKMEKNLKIPIVSAEIVSKQKLDIETAENWKIYFNPQKDIDWQITQISLLLKEKIIFEKRRELEYIDLRFDKIYISPDI